MYGYVSCHRAAEEYIGTIRAFKHRVSNIANCRRTWDESKSVHLHYDCLKKQTAVVHTAMKMKRKEPDNTPSTLLGISISWDIIKC